jgi:hypothetical protein
MSGSQMNPHGCSPVSLSPLVELPASAPVELELVLELVLVLVPGLVLTSGTTSGGSIEPPDDVSG